VANTGGAGLTGDSHDPAEVPDDMIVHHDHEDGHTDSHQRYASAMIAGITGGQE